MTPLGVHRRAFTENISERIDLQNGTTQITWFVCALFLMIRRREMHPFLKHRPAKAAADSLSGVVDGILRLLAYHFWSRRLLLIFSNGIPLSECMRRELAGVLSFLLFNCRIGHGQSLGVVGGPYIRLNKKELASPPFSATLYIVPRF